ncbi:MAG: hypothetical protein Kow00120_28040 [Anaerolineae bacterium]
MKVESHDKGLKPPASLNLQSRRDRRPGYWLAALAVLMLAGAFRAVLITELPPGIIHDEVWNRLNVQQVLDGVIAPYYTQGGGREALYFFLQAGSVATLGENLVAMRLPSVVLGTALVALTVALGARLFNRAVGLLAALALASSFWAVLFSRLAVRNMSLPVVIALAAYTLYRALTDDAGRWGRRARFALAGACLGLAPYSFPGAWGLPLFVAPLILYLACCERERMRGRWLGLAAAVVLAVLIVTPLVVYRQAHPEVAARAIQVDEPLRAALAGDFGPVLRNIPLVLSMFTVEGDHGLEYNLQWRPVFPEPLMSALFYLGVALAVWRAVRPGARAAASPPASPSPSHGKGDRHPSHAPGSQGATKPRFSEQVRQQRLPYLMVLLLSAAMLAPTILTSDARNPSRPIGLLAVLFFYVGLGACAVWRWLSARWGGAGRWLAAGLLAVAFGLNIVLTARDLPAWADNPVVRFLYQDDLYQIARYLDAEDAAAGDAPISIAGLTPDWVDPMSLRLLMARQDLAPSFFDGQGALLMPAGAPPAQVFVPDMLTLHPAVAAMLSEAGAPVDAAGFTLWTVTRAVRPPAGYTVTPAGAANAYAALQAVAWDSMTPGGAANLLSVWAMRGPSVARLRVFVHLMDAAQTAVLAQDDALHVPSLQWRAGEVFYQTHTLNLPADLPPGVYALRVGLYDPLTGVRVPFEDGADAVTVAVRVR